MRERIRQVTVQARAIACLLYEVGDEVILLEHLDVSSGLHWFTLVPDEGHGIPGNMNSNIRRYHGWRGTTNDVSLIAHGSREITKIVQKSPFDEYVYITVGPDLHPDWE